MSGSGFYRVGKHIIAGEGGRPDRVQYTIYCRAWYNWGRSEFDALPSTPQYWKPTMSLPWRNIGDVTDECALAALEDQIESRCMAMKCALKGKIIEASNAFGIPDNS
jgi:hypothetical protein